MTLARVLPWCLTSILCVSGCAPPVAPPPPVPSAPAITSFTAEKTVITTGQKARLTAVFADGSASIGGIETAVSSAVVVETAVLSADTTFTLTVTNTAGDAITATVSIHVVPAPRITRFSAAASLITSGDTTTLEACDFIVESFRVAA